MERAGHACEWPTCEVGRTVRGVLHLAHLEAIGAGGRASADALDNVAILCEMHHDILDGRLVASRRFEVRTLLASHLGRRL